MTVAQNVAFGLEMRGVNRTDRDRRVRDALALVGLRGFEDRYPRKMSGGQQQRVALARALVIRPPVLLLDEPLSNLDAKLREELQVELRSIQRNTGTTTILVTHDQAEAMALSDRLVVMNNGVVEQVDRPDVAYAHPANAFVANFLGKANMLKGECRDGQIKIGDATIPTEEKHLKGPIVATIRAERISFGAPDATAQRGQVKARIFQGSQWLFQVETKAGLVTVIEHNSGNPVPNEGDAVHLHFARTDMLLASAKP
jgi:putative spermidine/putrescine transport system ATP-binding protein